MTPRTSILAFISALAGTVACATAGPRAPRTVTPACVGNDTIYVRADTVRGLRLPDNRSTPRLSFRRQGTATAIVVIDATGHVTVESVEVTGELGSTEDRRIRAALPRWTFYPATLGGCAVRFRGPVSWRVGSP